MNIRFQADNDLNYDIVQAVRRREPAIDFSSAQEASLHGVQDPDLLTRVEASGRVLVTHDRRTMLRHFSHHLAEGHHIPGLLVVSQNAPVAAVVDAILLLWAAAGPEELRDRVYHLPSLLRHVFPR